MNFMKNTNKLIMVSVLMLSTLMMQASSRSTYLPQISRNSQNQNTPSASPLLRQSPVIKSARTTPLTFQSVSPNLESRESTPRLRSPEAIEFYTQDDINNLVKLNKQLTGENGSLLYRIKTQQDELGSLRAKTAQITKSEQDKLKDKQRFTLMSELINKQDQDLVNQSNKIIALQARIAQKNSLCMHWSNNNNK